MIDEKTVYSLWDRFDRSDAVELSYESGGDRLSLKRAFGGAQAVDSPVLKVEAPAQAVSDGYFVSSPVAGTFYQAAAPDADPYVSVGMQVREDDIVCIVESMKVMNELRAGIDGVVKEVLVQDGSTVGFGEKLIRIEPLDVEPAHV